MAAPIAEVVPAIAATEKEDSLKQVINLVQKLAGPGNKASLTDLFASGQDIIAKVNRPFRHFASNADANVL